MSTSPSIRKSVAILSAFPLYNGTTQAVLDYRRALEDLGYNVTLYQLKDTRSKEKFPSDCTIIEGINFLPQKVNFIFDLIFSLPMKLKKLKEDLIILTDPVLLPLRKYYPNSITIVHDLRDFTSFSRNPAKRLFYHYLFHYLSENDRVITVSDFTGVMIANLKKKALRLTVIPRCSSFVNSKEAVEKRIKHISEGEKEWRILYLAADRPYKNIKFFIKLAKLADSRPSVNVRLRFTILSKLRSRTKKLILKLAPSNLEVIEGTDDLYSVYNSTAVLLYPSFIEGFGLPLVEAMSFGIPIICSNKRPMVDIVGDSGLPLELSNSEEWISALERLTSDQTYLEFGMKSYNRGIGYSFENFKESLKKYLDSSPELWGDNES